MSINKLAHFDNQNYLNLESYRKTGEAIRTPLWFAEGDGVLYFYTVAHSYKVKRIQNNPRVRIAPCDVRGNLKGDWIDASARRLDADEASHADGLLNQKYGWQKRLLNFLAKLRGHQRAAFAIQPD
ncbi:MAG TPA: PPOX class F420-dependent oxidoreductase [Blastocatellia bacterium]